MVFLLVPKPLGHASTGTRCGIVAGGGRGVRGQVGSQCNYPSSIPSLPMTSIPWESLWGALSGVGALIGCLALQAEYIVFLGGQRRPFY